MEEGREHERRIYKMNLRKEWMAFWKNEDGLGVIEVVLILVVIIFKKQITTLLQSIFKEIESKSKEVY